MATLSQVLSYARAQSQTDSNGLTDENGIIFANEALLDFHRKLIDAGVDASQVQEAYRDAAAETGTYLYPEDMFFLKAIEVNLGSTEQEGYRTAQQVDVSNLAGQDSFSWLRKNGDVWNPQFDDRGDFFEIFPTPIASNNLNQAIRIMYFLEPTEYTSVNDVLSYPVTLDYRALAWRIAANYKRSLTDFASGDAFDAEYEKHMKQLIETLSRGTQQPTQATPITWTGWNF